MADYVAQNTPAGQPDEKVLQEIFKYVQNSRMVQDPNLDHINKFMEQNQQGRQNVESAYQQLQQGQKPSKAEKIGGYAAAGAFLFDSLFGSKDVKENLSSQVDETAKVFSDYRTEKNTKNRQAFMDALTKQGLFDNYNTNDYNALSQKENALTDVRNKRFSTAKELFLNKQANDRTEKNDNWNKYKQSKEIEVDHAWEIVYDMKAKKIKYDNMTDEQKRAVQLTGSGNEFPTDEQYSSYIIESKVDPLIKEYRQMLWKDESFLEQTQNMPHDEKIALFDELVKKRKIDLIQEFIDTDPNFKNAQGDALYPEPIGPGMNLNFSDLSNLSNGALDKAEAEAAKQAKNNEGMTPQQLSEKFIASNKKAGYEHPKSLSPVQLLQILWAEFGVQLDTPPTITGKPVQGFQPNLTQNSHPQPYR